MTEFNNLTITEANIIEQAIQSKHGTAKFWTSQTTPQMTQMLLAHGMSHIGFESSPVAPEQTDFWGVWKVTNLELASASIRKFKQQNNPISFTLTPFDNPNYYDTYKCTLCGSGNLHWTDGDSIPVPVLPEGINDYDDVDTVLMVGHCKDCAEQMYFYEFGFTTVTNPDDDDPFCVANLTQVPDQYQMYTAEADGIQPWVVSRRWYDTGKLHESLGANEDARRLPKGPFAVDYHHFGPFRLRFEGELSGWNGVSSCGSQGNDKWQAGTDLFNRLANSAMKKLRQEQGIRGKK